MGLAIHPSGSCSSESSSVFVRVSSSSGDPLVVVQGASLAEVQGKAASQTPPPTKARGKSHVAPAPGIGAPAPRACDDAISPDG
jgi:hypothetical protein